MSYHNLSSYEKTVVNVFSISSLAMLAGAAAAIIGYQVESPGLVFGGAVVGGLATCVWLGTVPAFVGVMGDLKEVNHRNSHD